MSCPANGPCAPFITELDLCCLVTGAFPDPCRVEGNAINQSKIDEVIMAASELMWAATGRQFGKCTAKIRPCQKNNCGETCDLPFFENGSMFGSFGWGASQFPWLPSFQNGVWTNVSCNCTGSCGCSKLCEIPLPDNSCCIQEVRVNGTVLGPSLYRIDDFNRLIRIAGQSAPQKTATATGPIGGPLVAGDLSFSGPGAVVSTDGFGLTGIELPALGSYTGTFTSPLLDPGHQDVNVELEIPVGVGADFNFLGIPSSQFEVISLQGGATITKTGSHIVVSNATYSDSPIRISVRVTQQFSKISQFTIQNNLLGSPPNNLKILSVQWSDLAKDGLCWPKCQDLNKQDTEDDTFSVTVTFGREVPNLVKLGTAELACQLLKACVGAPCQLPQRISSMTRQGVTVGFLDTMAFLDKRRTGIYLVDLAINTFNPRGLLKQASVFSLDAEPRWSRTDTGRDC